MIIRKLNEAKPYDAPNHRKYESLRIFGAEMGGSQGLIFGILVLVFRWCGGAPRRGASRRGARGRGACHAGTRGGR